MSRRAHELSREYQTVRSMETAIKSYPCESVLVRKGLSKLLTKSQGERSQAGSFGAMRPDNPTSGGVASACLSRESPSFGRSASPLPLRGSRGVSYGYPPRLSRVLGDVTRRKWLVSLTGEVPLRLRLPVE